MIRLIKYSGLFWLTQSIAKLHALRLQEENFIIRRERKKSKLVN